MPRRSPAEYAASAADELDAWLRQQGGAITVPVGGEEEGSGDEPGADKDSGNGAGHAPAGDVDPARSVESLDAVAAAVVTRRQEQGAGARVGPMWLEHPDWLYHRLTVTGPDGEVARFRLAAQGAGTIPWRLHLEQVEEDMFLLLAAPPAPQRRVLSLYGAGVLAKQIQEEVGARHGRAVARVGRSRACPLDLHALVPVPDEVLRLGPDHPDALAWLWEHWGTTEALRHVAVQETIAPEQRARPSPRRVARPSPAHSRVATQVSEEADTVDVGAHAVFRLTFWSADWTPWRALARIAEDWPALRFEVQPLYEGP